MRYLILFLLLPSLALAVPDAPANLDYSATVFTEDASLPDVIYDDYLEGWMVDMYLGNVATRSWWYDGPQREVGGRLRASGCISGPDNKTYCSHGPQGQSKRNIIQVDDSTGIARLFMDMEGTETGPTEEAMGGYLIYDDYNDTLYLQGYGYCIRKMVSDGDGTYSIENFAGNCSTSGSADGTGTDARFGSEMYGVAADGTGNLWVLEGDGTSPKVRKITSAGVVSTPTTPTRSDCTIKWQTLNDAPGLLRQGENSTTMYIKDYYNTTCGHATLKWDLTANTLTRLIGVDPRSDTYSQYNLGNDGPGMDFYSAPNGLAKSDYSRFYESIFLAGQDETSMHRYSFETGWVKTFWKEYADPSRPGIMKSTATITGMNGTGMSLELNFNPAARFNTTGLVSGSIGDSRGGFYLTFGNPETGLLWRMYNPLLGGTQ